MQISTQNSKPQISFIITTYNIDDEMLRSCIDSILRLSLSRDDREIILVDDGSDLPPLTSLSDIIDEIIYIRQRNQGLSAARNRGLQIANGEYIQFVDGDDMLIQAPYEHCLDIARYHNPDMVIFDTSHSPTSEVAFEYNGPISGSEYMHSYNLHATACGYIFRRSILHTLRFTPGILHEDEEFTPQLLLRAERVFSTKAKAYYYRQRSQSIMHNNNRRHQLKRLHDTRNIIFRLQYLASTLPEADRVALNRRIAQLSMDYLYNTILLTHSSKHLDIAIQDLRSKGLFPLPDKDYTKKYMLFRKAINSRLGRRMLLLSIH